MLEHMLHNKQRLETAIQVESFVKHLHEVVFSPNHMLGKKPESRLRFSLLIDGSY